MRRRTYDLAKLTTVKNAAISRFSLNVMYIPKNGNINIWLATPMPNPTAMFATLSKKE